MPERSDPTPDLAHLERLLQSIRPEPGARFRQKMARMPWQAAASKNEGVLKMNAKFRLAALAALVVALIAVLVVTPAGRVLAGQLAELFTRAPGNRLPLPAEQIVTPRPSPTPKPTDVLSLQPAEQAAAAFTTATPRPTLDFGPQRQDVSLAEVEAMVGFTLFQPACLPRDYRLTRIMYSQPDQAVKLEYTSPQAATGEFIEITQARQLDPLPVGAGAKIETVEIGGHSAKFVRGIWFAPAGSSDQNWESGPEWYTMRWQAGEITLSILFAFNETVAPAYLEREEMLAFARSLTQTAAGEGAAGCEPPSDPQQPGLFASVPDLEASAGFDVLEPGVLPAGLGFSHARQLTPGTVTLFYGSYGPDKMRRNGPSLILSQTLRTHFDGTLGGYPPEAIEVVAVNGYSGQLVRGSLETFMSEPGQPTPEPVWHEEDGTLLLTWKTEEMSYTLLFHSSLSGERVTPEQLFAIAESLH